MSTGIPTRLTIPTIGVHAGVDTTTESEGSLLIPENIDDTGWDDKTAIVGAAHGTTLIAGHRDNSAGDHGALYRLDDLAKGDRVVVGVKGKGTRIYEVTSTRTYPKSGLPASIVDVSPEAPQRLALVTCGGPLVRSDLDGRYHYRDNIVVWATMVT